MPFLFKYKYAVKKYIYYFVIINEIILLSFDAHNLFFFSSKKNKSKNTDSVQHNTSKNSTKEENNVQRKTQKGKHKDSNQAQSSSGHSPVPRTDGPNNNTNRNSGKLTDVIEMNNKNTQTTYVHITEKQSQTKPVSASIKIVRSESPVLPPSPISSSSSSLFTPFGSLSSNFLSSSSPSPPPSSNNQLSFGSVGNSTNAQEGTSPVNNYAAPSGMEQKRQSPNPLYSNENNESLFSHHMNYQHQVSNDCGSYNGHLHNEGKLQMWTMDFHIISIPFNNWLSNFIS